MFLHLDDKNSIVAGTPEELVDNVLKESFIGAGTLFSSHISSHIPSHPITSTSTPTQNTMPT